MQDKNWENFLFYVSKCEDYQKLLSYQQYNLKRFKSVAKISQKFSVMGWKRLFRRKNSFFLLFEFSRWNFQSRRVRKKDVTLCFWFYFYRLFKLENAKKIFFRQVLYYDFWDCLIFLNFSKIFDKATTVLDRCSLSIGVQFLLHKISSTQQMSAATVSECHLKHSDVSTLADCSSEIHRSWKAGIVTVRYKFLKDH